MPQPRYRDRSIVLHITKLQFFFAFTNFSYPYFTRKTAQRTIAPHSRSEKSEAAEHIPTAPHNECYTNVALSANP